MGRPGPASSRSIVGTEAARWRGKEASHIATATLPIGAAKARSPLLNRPQAPRGWLPALARRARADSSEKVQPIRSVRWLPVGGTGAFDDEGEGLGHGGEAVHDLFEGMSYQGATYYGRMTV